MGYLLAAAAVASTFNLLCSGEVKSFGAGEAGSEPFEKIYRVDLDSGKWCEGECSEQKPLAKVTGTSLTLEDELTEGATNRTERMSMVSRETGEFVSKSIALASYGRLSLFYRGRCDVAQFTGFPELETKF
jgi:hypothetical protein